MLSMAGTIPYTNFPACAGGRWMAITFDWQHVILTVQLKGPIIAYIIVESFKGENFHELVKDFAEKILVGPYPYVPVHAPHMQCSLHQNNFMEKMWKSSPSNNSIPPCMNQWTRHKLHIHKGHWTQSRNSHQLCFISGYDWSTPHTHIWRAVLP